MDLQQFGVPSAAVTFVVGVVALLVLVLLRNKLMRLFGVVLVPEGNIAIVNKKFVLLGAHKYLPEGQIIALHGEAGWQADTLAPGLYTGFWPWQYEISMQAFVEVSEGELGLVQAVDGAPLPSGRVLGDAVDCQTFQNAAAFLVNGGQRGPQMAVIPPGQYRINTALFKIRLVPATDIPDGHVGVVVTREGSPLADGEIAGRTVAGHRQFQDAHAFVVAGGTKGLQEQVLLAGRYYLNPDFVEVEMNKLSTVPIAFVGVINAFVGEVGVDISGDRFKHGNLVERNHKGVWADPLDPGMYPINPRTHRLELVPTANVVLNWATGKTESHNLDKTLSTITVRSSDGFTFNLDVSQIIHVPRTSAARVIARFGNMANLVTQVLEPTIGNYFRNAAQQSDVIDFLKNRQTRQAEARECIGKALAEYDVEAVDTLIGDIAPPADLMKTLTDRKLAEQQRQTFSLQTEAEVTRKALEQARAIADTQKTVVDAERKVSIEEFNAQALIKRSEGEAASQIARANGDAAARRSIADADAHVTTTTGKADAEKVLAIGKAEAEATRLRIESVEAGNYAAIEIARAFASSKVPLVPEILSGSGGDQTGMSGNLITALLTRTLFANGHSKPENPAVQ